MINKQTVYSILVIYIHIHNCKYNICKILKSFVQKNLGIFVKLTLNQPRGGENPHVSDVKIKKNAIGIMLFEQHIR